ncbi:transcriptional regulator [Aquimarina macrocephali]|uniref:transcriptional regulator n=1 Tax=Aquimarina macrocephali TaxID=666563 RepID=UPI003F665F50
MLFKEISEKIKISTTDIEISIIESPATNWGFRGMEKNKYVPSTVLALKIARLFKKPVEDIFLLEEED